MKLMIDIDKDDYEYMKNGYVPSTFKIFSVIKNGTPIPDNATVCNIEQIKDEIEGASNRCNNAIAKGCYLFCLGVIDKYGGIK